MMLGIVGSILRNTPLASSGVYSARHHAAASKAPGFLFFSVATVAITTQRPVSGITVTKLDYNPGRATWKQQPQQQQQPRQHPQQQIPPQRFYGTTLEAKDVAYDEPTKEALATIRNMKRDDVPKEQSSVLQDSGTQTDATLTLIGYKGGPMNVQINQDRSFVVSPFYLSPKEHGQNPTPDRRLLGVFDGHAPLGEKVSQYSMDELPTKLANKLLDYYEHQNPQDVSQEEDETVKQILIETFVELDKTAPAEISGGCTASVIFQQGPKIYVANAGDSSSFLVMYRSKSRQVEIIYMSREDKPALPDERQRVEAMGGQVYVPLAGTSRVIYIDTATGSQSGLAMSRSIGDWAAGKLGVIPDPIVGVINVEEFVRDQLQLDSSGGDDAIIFDEYVGAEPSFSSSLPYTSANNPKSSQGSDDRDDDDDIHIFAVSATDGLMDYAPAEAIAKVLAKSLYEENGPHLLTACEQLIYYAAQGWFQTRGGTYRDDIAIAVSAIRSP